eukprot:6217876-Pyramimonas_sp.AAC.1
MLRRRSERVSGSVLLTPPHEAISAEHLADPELAGKLDGGVAGSPEWADAHAQHPAARAAAGRPMHPVALYIDGVRYTRSIGL